MVALAALVLGVLVAQLAVAGGANGSGSSKASASAVVSAAKFKKLQKQVAALQAKVDALSKKAGSPGPQGPPGPQGAQGPAGTAPACQGNGSGDTMVAAGAVCIDKYEASVWSSPTGGFQYGTTSDNYPCEDNGQNCTNIYARSVPGVTPSLYITYFQAQQALANSGKRLPTNAEWQQAVAGTPDTIDDELHSCNTLSFVIVKTGSRSACVSRFGAMDMVGNAEEWVADWVPFPATGGCPGWGAFSNDQMCLFGTSTATGPGAPLRGGYPVLGPESGPFQIEVHLPQASNNQIGFRGVR